MISRVTKIQNKTCVVKSFFIRHMLPYFPLFTAHAVKNTDPQKEKNSPKKERRETRAALSYFHSRVNRNCANKFDARI